MNTVVFVAENAAPYVLWAAALWVLVARGVATWQAGHDHRTYKT